MLFPEVDEKATRDKVDELLKRYHTYRRLAGMPIEQKVTATYSLEPKSFGGGNSDKIADSVAIKVDAEPIYQDIIKAINILSVKSRKRIYEKYISGVDSPLYEVVDGENISESTYKRDLGKAQIEFAEAFRGGELLVFEMNDF